MEKEENVGKIFLSFNIKFKYEGKEIHTGRYFDEYKDTPAELIQRILAQRILAARAYPPTSIPLSTRIRFVHN